MIISERSALEIMLNPSVVRILPKLASCHENVKHAKLQVERRKGGNCGKCDLMSEPEGIEAAKAAFGTLLGLRDDEISMVKKLMGTGIFIFAKKLPSGEIQETKR